MNLPRFFAPDLSAVALPTSGVSELRHIELLDTEAHHLTKVLRLGVGAQVELFDGQGNRAQGVVEQAAKNRVTVSVSEIERSVSHRATRLVVATSLPKGDRQKWLIEKLTELGVDGVVPLWTERGVAQPTDSALERLQRVSLEACKQSRNDRMLQILPPSSLEKLITHKETEQKQGWLLAHPYVVDVVTRQISHGESSSESLVSSDAMVVSGSRALQQWFTPPLNQLTVAIGPEGGFTDQEVLQACQAGWRAWCFSEQILRVETAVLVAATLLLDFVSNHKLK